MNTNSEPGASSKPRVITSASDRSTSRDAHDPSPPGTPAAESIDYGIDSHASGMTPPESNSRVGKLRLDALRMSLSARDSRIIGTLKQHRFLSTNHLERWHFSDHASKLSAARTTRRVLARLKHLGVITALDRRLGGAQGGSTQHVWHLTSVGERLGVEQQGRRVREPSTAFLHHELGIASIHLAFIEAERAGTLRLIDFTTEPRCWRRFPGAGGQAVTLKPDFFAVVAAHPGYESLYFGEYDRASESARTIVRKAGVYEAYWRTGIEERRSGGFPQVLWIAPEETRVTRIQRELGRTAGITMELHAFTTPGEVIAAISAEETEAQE